MREGEDCPDKPYAVQLSLMSRDGKQLIKEFASNQFGDFKVSVSPGVYIIRSTGTSVTWPYCSTSEITVKSGAYTNENVSCDTGIR